MNIYVAYPATSPESGVRSAWVDRRYFSTLAGVNTDVIELWHFDCGHDRGYGRSGVSESMNGGAETANQQVRSWVCGDGGPVR
jgi:hypothetical protein